MKDFMTYEDFLQMMKTDLPPAPDKCPVTLVFEMGKYDTIRFGKLKKALPSIKMPVMVCRHDGHL